MDTAGPLIVGVAAHADSDDSSSERSHAGGSSAKSLLKMMPSIIQVLFSSRKITRTCRGRGDRPLREVRA
jgi:hypothetical protein